MRKVPTITQIYIRVRDQLLCHFPTRTQLTGEPSDSNSWKDTSFPRFCISNLASNRCSDPATKREINTTSYASSRIFIVKRRPTHTFLPIGHCFRSGLPQYVENKRVQPMEKGRTQAEARLQFKEQQRQQTYTSDFLMCFINCFESIRSYPSTPRSLERGRTSRLSFVPP